MSREIKFRGVCAISKEIVNGDLIHGVGAKSNNVYILPNRINLAGVKHCHPLDGVNVLPESVGQFTGLKDKFGQEIYEGDILAFEREKNFVKDYVYPFVVEWDSERAAWIQFSPRELVKVIGNIYENPELL